MKYITNEVKTNIKEWIVPCNTDYYDISSALKDLKTIDWKQSVQMNNANVGDLVYLYCKRSGKTGRILYKGAILEVKKNESIIDDSKYSSDHMMGIGPCFSLAVFRVYELGDDLGYPKLKEFGLKSRLQGPVIVKGTVADYLHVCDDKQRQIDRFDGTIPDECLINFPIEITEIISGRDSADKAIVDSSEEAYVIEALDDTHSDEEKIEHADSLAIGELEAVAKQQSTNQPKEITTTVVQKIRDPYIAEYARRRANGICQLCGAPAPFNRTDGTPYLESHHIDWLSEGGADSVENTVALCPNCHRKMHVVRDPKDLERLKSVNKLLADDLINSDNKAESKKSSTKKRKKKSTMQPPDDMKVELAFKYKIIMTKSQMSVHEGTCFARVNEEEYERLKKSYASGKYKKMNDDESITDIFQVFEKACKTSDKQTVLIDYPNAIIGDTPFEEITVFQWDPIEGEKQRRAWVEKWVADHAPEAEAWGEEVYKEHIKNKND